MQADGPSACNRGWPAVWGHRLPISSRQMYQARFGFNGRVMEQEKLRPWCHRAFALMCLVSSGLLWGSGLSRPTLWLRSWRASMSPSAAPLLCVSAARGSLVLFWLLAAMEISRVPWWLAHLHEHIEVSWCSLVVL